MEDGENHLTPEVKTTPLQRLRNHRKRTRTLKERLSAPETTVFRDGFKLVVDSSQIVPGDIILLKTGDLVPADARLLHTDGLSCEESKLTGQKLSVCKDASLILSVDTPLTDRCNMVYSGCQITSGSGAAVVTATGRNTEIARIPASENG